MNALEKFAVVRSLSLMIATLVIVLLTVIVQ